MTTLRTSAADRNVLSLNHSSIVWYAGTPDEHEGQLPYPFHLSLDDPAAWSSSLKLSNCSNIMLGGIRAAQCMENTIDINNRATNCALEGVFGHAELRGDQCVTIKGGSSGITIKGVVMSDEGRKGDLTVGCWSDQSTDTTHHIDLSLLRHSTGRPLTVILGRVNSPLRSILLGHSPDIVLPPNARIKIWASLGEVAYWWLKRLYVAARTRRWSW